MITIHHITTNKDKITVTTAVCICWEIHRLNRLVTVTNNLDYE